MTITIPYFGNQIGLATLLVQLQPQLHPDDDIYIIDSSPTHSGLLIANMYGSTRCYLFVEVGIYTPEEAIRFGRQSAKENKQKGFLVLNEGAVISSTLIANYKRELKKGLDPVPTHIQVPYPRMLNDFQWYYPDFKSEIIVILPYKAPSDTA